MKDFFNTFKHFASEKNLFPKLLCLFLSIILWAYIGNKQSGRVLLRIPIEYKNLSDDLIISEYSDKYMFVTLEGRKEYLKGLSVKNIHAYVDLSSPTVSEPKAYSIQLIKQHIPENVAMNPSIKDVTLIIEKMRNKWIQIIPKIVGSASVGKAVGKWKAFPEYVMASGPITKLKDLNFVYTDDVPVENANADIVRNVEINRDKYEGVTFSETTIRITVPIVNSENIYSVELPIVAQKVDERFKIVFLDSKARVNIKQNDNNKLDVNDLEAYIDANALNYNQMIKDRIQSMERALPVSIRLKQNKNANVDIISVIPAIAVFTVKKR